MMKKGTFIAFGNMRTTFPRMANIVVKNLEFMPQPVVIQAGANIKLLHSINTSACIFEYCNPQTFKSHLAESLAVICHAGVGAVSGAIDANIRPAIIPRRARLGEHVDDHQLELARELLTHHIAVSVEAPGELHSYFSNNEYAIPENANINFFRNSRMIAEIQSQILRYLEK